MARPLTHRTKDGALLVRPARVDAAIDAALPLDDASQLERARRWDARTPDCLPLEAVLHLVREAHRAGKLRHRDRLLAALLGRVEGALARAIPARSGRAADLRADALGAFSERLARGLQPSHEGDLDFFECDFLGALAAIRATAARKIQARDRLEKPASAKLAPGDAEERDAELAELADEDPFAASARTAPQQEHTTRLAELARLIETFPPNEQRVLVMIYRHRYDVDQVASALGVDRRTINRWRSDAIARLRKLEGDVR